MTVLQRSHAPPLTVLLLTADAICFTLFMKHPHPSATTSGVRTPMPSGHSVMSTQNLIHLCVALMTPSFVGLLYFARRAVSALLDYRKSTLMLRLRHIERMAALQKGVVAVIPPRTLHHRQRLPARVIFMPHQQSTQAHTADNSPPQSPQTPTSPGIAKRSAPQRTASSHIAPHESDQHADPASNP
jgi:hypothetical protein